MPVHTLNLGLLNPPEGPPGTSGCRCLLLETSLGVVLVDCGFGLAELQFPELIFGSQALSQWGIVGDPDLSALRQLEGLGLRARDVRHIVCTHLDMDHAGGLVDFPLASVHVASEECASLLLGHPRYLPHQFRHGPKWVQWGPSSGSDFFGLPARPLALGLQRDILLVPLFGHTAGHCGVAIPIDEGGWLFHIGDAYYRRSELDDWPVSPEFPKITAEDDGSRLQSLGHLHRLANRKIDQVSIFSSHDLEENPQPQT